jgi:hypothetical protein
MTTNSAPERAVVLGKLAISVNRTSLLEQQRQASVRALRIRGVYAWETVHIEREEHSGGVSPRKCTSTQQQLAGVCHNPLYTVSEGEPAQRACTRVSEGRRALCVYVCVCVGGGGVMGSRRPPRDSRTTHDG